MIIFRCDKCGKEHQRYGIVKNRLKTFGYQELEKPFKDIVDVCGTCFSEIQDAYYRADKEIKEIKFERVKKILGIS